MKRPDDIDGVNLAQFENARKRTLDQHLDLSFIRTYRPLLDDDPAAPSTRWPTTASGVTRTCPGGWGFPGGRKTGIRETRGRSSAASSRLRGEGAIGEEAILGADPPETPGLSG